MALGYLISPVLQIENTNGLPLTGGFLRVYLADTTIKAVTYRDFDGNKNPNDVLLDSKGMAVLIAEEGLYDVYCYDRYGVQQWSRKRLTICGGSGGDIKVSTTVPFFKGKGVDGLWYPYDGSNQVEMTAFDIATMATALPDGTFSTVPACNDSDTFKVEIVSGYPRLFLYKPGVFVVRALIHFKWAGTPVAEFARVDGRPFDLSYQHSDSHEKQANIINNGRETPIMCNLIVPAASFEDVPESGMSVRCQSITIERLGDYIEPIVGE